MEGSKRYIDTDDVEELKKRIKRWEAAFDLAVPDYFTKCATCGVPFPENEEDGEQCEECQ